MNRELAVERLPLRLFRVSLLFAAFMAYSVLRIPVPGVNEPHYLTKSRHFWLPEWCAGDMFLESANAHQFFYQTVGWLAAAFSFEQAAWIGRALALLLLAFGWDRLLSCLTGTRSGSLWAAWLFLLFHAFGNFSGEWLVGGVEAKVFAYAFVFWGCGCLLQGSTLKAAAFYGLAVSMHPVVGAWSVLAVSAATAVQFMLSRRKSEPANQFEAGIDSVVRSLRPPRGLIPVAVFLLLSLPGLLPAFDLVLSSDPALAQRGNFIQFTHRLSHHLDPLTFPFFSYAYYAVLIGVWLAARLWIGKWIDWTQELRWFQWLVAASILVAVAGLLIACGPRPVHLMPLSDLRVSLLKLYPFRLADILVPLLISVLIVRLAEHFLRSQESFRLRRPALFAGFGLAFVLALWLPGPDRNPADMDHETERDWLDVCLWIRAETPQDCVVYAVNENWAMKWYAQRPEYVSFKDCPQDAAGIVEWYERQRYLSDWSGRAFADGMASAAELTELHDVTGISYLISRKLDRMPRLPVYQNETFFVYALANSDANARNGADSPEDGEVLAVPAAGFFPGELPARLASIRTDL